MSVNQKNKFKCFDRKKKTFDNIFIITVHVNGQNGTLKIVCGVPGIIPTTQYTTLQSLDLSTKSSDHSTLTTHFGKYILYYFR